ncbi:PEP-utilizing enzyme [Streptomyces diacarni]|uniref:PEP-utilizing enzyme n=1 Tax=Streptomyces diacarni TaxID=2800381 RepID=UPI0033EDA840
MTGPRVRLGTKAETLARLAPALTTARVLPLAHFTLDDWRRSRTRLLADLLRRDWASGPLIVRSSAVIEDTGTGSQAGRFTSLVGRRGRSQLADAVDQVFGSYDQERPQDQVLVQPQLVDVRGSGVAFSCDPSNGAPYAVVNWSDGARTDAVTGGRSSGLRISYGAFYDPSVVAPSPFVAAVWDLLSEVVALTGEPRLEIEFAQSPEGETVLLQARPLAVATETVDKDAHRTVLTRVARRIAEDTERPARGVLGSRGVFGVMPDWNPAEMIGLRPRPLPLSLYRRLITDQVWAHARHRYGYRDLRGTPLMVDFGGLPYVDVRASVTSFIPADVPDALASRLVDHWLGELVESPHLHDKLESHVVVSAWGFRTGRRIERLADAGFGAHDRDMLSSSLRGLTDRLVRSDLWERDLARFDRLGGARTPAVHAPGCPADRPGCCGPAVAGRLALCAEFGTEPFAALARAAFIATGLLEDLSAEEVFTRADVAAFVGGLGLVSGTLQRDLAVLDREDFLKRYGHLRPGTYDLLSPRYDEAPERYFDWSTPRHVPEDAPPFTPSPSQLRRIDDLIAREGLTFDAERLLRFAAAAIRGREKGKFDFTAVLSDTLVEIKLLGERLGFTPDDLSYVPVDTIAALTGRRADDRRILRTAVARGREAYEATRVTSLPPLVAGERDAFSFVIPQAQPNFITQKRALAPVADIDAGAAPEGAIAFVTSADPGYDWLFARNIAGLVTAFGGANSHMAIRALELGIPSVIGAGEALFHRWSQARMVDIDAASGMVVPL